MYRISDCPRPWSNRGQRWFSKRMTTCLCIKFVSLKWNIIAFWLHMVHKHPSTATTAIATATMTTQMNSWNLHNYEPFAWFHFRRESVEAQSSSALVIVRHSPALLWPRWHRSPCCPIKFLSSNAFEWWKMGLRHGLNVCVVVFHGTKLFTAESIYNLKWLTTRHTKRR